MAVLRIEVHSEMPFPSGGSRKWNPSGDEHRLVLKLWFEWLGLLLAIMAVLTGLSVVGGRDVRHDTAPQAQSAADALGLPPEDFADAERTE